LGGETIAPLVLFITIVANPRKKRQRSFKAWLIKQSANGSGEKFRPVLLRLDRALLKTNFRYSNKFLSKFRSNCL
jgi:hypothetical protein